MPVSKHVLPNISPHVGLSQHLVILSQQHSFKIRYKAMFPGCADVDEALVITLRNDRRGVLRGCSWPWPHRTGFTILRVFHIWNFGVFIPQWPFLHCCFLVYQVVVLVSVRRITEPQATANIVAIPSPPWWLWNGRYNRNNLRQRVIPTETMLVNIHRVKSQVEIT